MLLLDQTQAGTPVLTSSTVAWGLNLGSPIAVCGEGSWGGHGRARVLWPMELTVCVGSLESTQCSALRPQLDKPRQGLAGRDPQTRGHCVHPSASELCQELGTSVGLGALPLSSVPLLGTAVTGSLRAATAALWVSRTFFVRDCI